MRELLAAAVLYFAAMDGLVYLLTGESAHHALVYKGPNERIGGPEHLERQDREEFERLQYLERKYRASGMSAFGQDPQGLEAKPASPTAGGQVE